MASEAGPGRSRSPTLRLPPDRVGRQQHLAGELVCLPLLHRGRTRLIVQDHVAPSSWARLNLKPVGRGRAQRFAQRFGAIYTPAMVALAAAVAVLGPGGRACSRCRRERLPPAAWVTTPRCRSAPSRWRVVKRVTHPISLRCRTGNRARPVRSGHWCGRPLPRRRWTSRSHRWWEGRR
jgi:hypothetical protein